MYDIVLLTICLLRAYFCFFLILADKSFLSLIIENSLYLYFRPSSMPT